MSNALARLRELVGDPLFVRSGRGLVPTPRALELQPHVARAVREMELALERGASFDPDAAARTFVLCAADNHQASEIPHVARAFAKALPRARLRIVSTDYLAATDGLAHGDVDCVLAPAMLDAPGLHRTHVFQERAAIVVRKKHPSIGAKIGKTAFNQGRHIVIEVALGKTGVGHEIAAKAFAAEGLVRDVAIVVPHFTAAAIICAETDWIAGLPERFARVMCARFPLAIVAPSFALPHIDMALTWHERTHEDPGARYFRELVLRAITRRGAPRS